MLLVDSENNDVVEVEEGRVGEVDTAVDWLLLELTTFWVLEGVKATETEVVVEDSIVEVEDESCVVLNTGVEEVNTKELLVDASELELLVEVEVDEVLLSDI